MSKPPLELFHTIEDASGRPFRIGPTEAHASDRPLDFGFETEAGEGFSGGRMAFRRAYAGDYPDTAPLNSLVTQGIDGRIGYEGRSSGPARSLDSGGSTVRLDFEGWMSHARQTPFCALGIDSDTSAWGELDPACIASLASGGWVINKNYTVSPEGGAITWTGEKGSTIPYLALAGTGYAAPPGSKVGSVSFAGTVLNAGPVVGPDLRTGAAPTALGNIVYPTFDGVRRTVAVTPGRFLGSLIYSNGSPNHTPANAYFAQMKQVQVIADFGLTPMLRSDGMLGIPLSDLITWLFSRWAPKIDTSQIRTNQYPVPHAIWRELTNVHEAAKDLNRYSQWALGIYEGQALEFRPFDLSVADWQVRAGEDGVEIETQGQTVNDAANGVVVTYTDFSGTEQMITPADSSDLIDNNPAIAANQFGDEAWIDRTISGMCSADDAVMMGRALLLDFNRPKFPSTIKVTGHIRNGRGQWEQAWRVRSNQTIRVTNHPNDLPRLITKTEWAGNTLTITTDNALNRMDAVLARMENARLAGGIS